MRVSRETWDKEEGDGRGAVGGEKHRMGRDEAFCVVDDGVARSYLLRDRSVSVLDCWEGKRETHPRRIVRIEQMNRMILDSDGEAEHGGVVYRCTGVPRSREEGVWRLMSPGRGEGRRSWGFEGSRRTSRGQNDGRLGTTD